MYLFHIGDFILLILVGKMKFNRKTKKEKHTDRILNKAAKIEYALFMFKWYKERIDKLTELLDKPNSTHEGTTYHGTVAHDYSLRIIYSFDNIKDKDYIPASREILNLGTLHNSHNRELMENLITVFTNEQKKFKIELAELMNI